MKTSTFIAMFFVAFAGTVSYSPLTFAKEICKSSGSSIHDVKCSNDKLKQTEAKLKVHYQRLLIELDKITLSDPVRLAELKPKLIASQKAWAVFREAECKAVRVRYSGGTLQESLYSECLNASAKKRIEQLNSFTQNRT
jgi:uncharacterized protein YecT (DUF1311 family)